jgi:hypothetical protein
MTDYAKKRSWHDGVAVRQIGPVMFKPKPTLDDDCTGYAIRWHEEEAEDRARLMEEFPEFFEMVVELAEAEATYAEVKNLKKKDPPTFYAARDRMYRARHEVAGFGDIHYSMSALNVKAWKRKRELSLERYCKKLNEEEARFYEPTTFAAWLKQQAQDHQWAVENPGQIIAASVLGILLRGPNSCKEQSIHAEIQGRAKVYLRLVEILERESVEAATQQYQGSGLEELRNLTTWHMGTDERTYWNDGDPTTKEVGCNRPILSREIRKHFKT